MGLGSPAMFTAVDDEGNTNYTTGCQLYKSAGIEYKMATTNICSSIWGLNASDDPSDVYSDDADWVDYKTFKGSQGTHDTKYDSFYEMKIPFSALGIDKKYIETNGIGAQVDVTGTAGFTGQKLSGSIVLGPEENILYGDINGDGKITVDDVTLLQLFVSGDKTIDSAAKIRADVNKDGVIDVLDCTDIQLYIAGDLSKLG